MRLQTLSVSVLLILHVWREAGDGFWGEVLGETEILKAFEGTVQATVVCYRTGLIEVDVRMFLQVVERERVDIQLMGLGILDDQIILGIKRKILDFIELIDTDIPPKSLSILHHLPCEIRPDAWHHLQLCGISRIEHDMLPRLEFHLIMRHHRVALPHVESLSPSEGSVAINDLRADIDRLGIFLIGLMTEGVAGDMFCRDAVSSHEFIGCIVLATRQEDDT